jgi:hypothetical protein
MAFAQCPYHFFMFAMYDAGGVCALWCFEFSLGTGYLVRPRDTLLDLSRESRLWWGGVAYVQEAYIMPRAIDTLVCDVRIEFGKFEHLGD